MIDKQPIDCRSEEGITIGLIDAIISISTILSPRLEQQRVNWEQTESVQAALDNLGSDQDFANILTWANLTCEKYDED